jgi:hypothetical protein
MCAAAALLLATTASVTEWLAIQWIVGMDPMSILRAE